MTSATVSTVAPTITAFSQLEKSTVALLDAAFKLKEHKEYYDHEEYLALLKANGWKYGGTEEKRLLAVATAFNPFIHCIQKLSKIEPKTIYQLADEKLAPVITRLQGMASGITQDLVVKFIRHQQNLLRKQKNGMAREGWKYRKNGRFYRVELIEEGDWTGRAIEALRQKGHATTEIVREAMQLLIQQEGWEVKIKTDNQETPSSIEQETVLEPVQVTPGAVPTCFQPIQEDIEEKLFNELLVEFKSCESWDSIRNVLYCCNAITRSSAWNELSEGERKKVWTEMPGATKKLALAKKEGVVRDYREQLCGKKYEIYTWDDDAPFVVNAPMVERTLVDIKNSCDGYQSVVERHN